MNKAVVILAAGTLAFGSASAYLYKDLHAAREEAASLQIRVEELQKLASPFATSSTAADSVPLNPFESPRQVPPSSDAANASPPPALASALTSAPLPATGPVAGIAVASNPSVLRFGGGWESRNRMLQNPDYQDAMKQQQRLMLPRMYPDLRTAMNLDELQAEQFYDLLAEQQMNQMTSRPLFSQPGTAPDPVAMREWQTQQQQLQKDNEAAIANLLGEAGAQEWKTYQSTLPARSQVRELRSTFDEAGVPLRPDQAEQLVTAMTAEQKRSMSEMQSMYANQGARTRQGMVNGRMANRAMWSEQILTQQRQQQQNLRAAAAPILSSRQMRELEKAHAAQIELTEISMRMSRAQEEAEARGETNSVQSATGVFRDR